MGRIDRAIAALTLASMVVAACAQSGPTAIAVGSSAPSAEPSATPVPVAAYPTSAAPAAEPIRPDPIARAAGPVATLVAAGDIASCEGDGDEQTAALIDKIPGTVITLGDNAYDRGTAADFACYDASWGRYRDRTRASPGNHDYATGNASAYFAYFGERAGDRATGYYSFDLGAWHVIALNSNCWAIGGCGRGSAQERWLRDDLARSTARCTLAYWHHPRFSSGLHGSDPATADLFRALYDHDADVVLVGHDHHYERFAPQDPDGNADPARGIREFVVGTGGRSIYPVGAPIPNSEAIAQAFGALELTLRADAYDWRFVPVAGATASDRGSGGCH